MTRCLCFLRACRGQAVCAAAPSMAALMLVTKPIFDIAEQAAPGQLMCTRTRAQGPLQPELYRSGAAALQMGVESGPQMTPECAVIKMMQCLKYKDIPLGVPLAGEL